MTNNREHVVDIYLSWFDEILKNSVFKTIDVLQKFLLTLCDTLDNEKPNFTKFSEKFFSMMTVENSLIYKQIKKQDYEQFNDIKMWSKIYKDSLERFITKINVLSLREFIMDMKDLTDSDKLETSPRRSMDYWANLTGDKDKAAYRLFDISLPFLDIYVILRILKQPVDEETISGNKLAGIRSTLSFCFFGNYHVENILYILSHLETYDIIISQEDKSAFDKSYRCQTFSFPLNLTEEVRKHNEAIDKEKIK